VSEYQYDEFLAVDRPLDAKSLAAVRALSTRARITPTSFVNTYQWGDFKGDPRALVERYYDAFLSTANWGTRQVMLRLPVTLLDLETAEQYCTTDAASSWSSGEHVILDLTCGADDGGEWNDNSDDVESPVPPGLADLPGPLQSLTAFLHVDDGLLSVAAQASPPLNAGSPTDAELAARIADLPGTDKDALLLRVVQGNVHVGAELHRRLTPAPAGPATGHGRRTVAQLRAGADNHRAERERLAALARDGESAWQRVDALIRATTETEGVRPGRHPPDRPARPRPTRRPPGRVRAAGPAHPGHLPQPAGPPAASGPGRADRPRCRLNGRPWQPRDAPPAPRSGSSSPRCDPGWMRSFFPAA
jgi:hypothetical protein